MNIFKRIIDKWLCLHDWEIDKTINFYESSKDKIPTKRKDRYD